MQLAMPTCSIIIPVYNRASLTRQCLDALLAQPTPIPTEILVVDDGSRDPTPRLLAGYGDRIRVLTHGCNRGFATACNHGAAAARGEWLVFLNNDTIPQPGWLDALFAYAAAHPAAVVVGAKLLFPNDTVQHAGVVICQDRYPRHLYAGFPADHPAVNRSRRLQIVTAACALVRRAAFEQARGFDTAFVNGYEDVDLCLRLGELGHEVHYCHTSVLYHFESVSEDRFREVTHNTQLYRDRWAARVRPDDVDHYLADGLLTVTYRDLYPVQLEVSPLLALMAETAGERTADRLLGQRARQVYDLLKQTIQLSVRLREVEEHATAAPAPPATPSAPVPPAPPAAPHVIQHGRRHAPTTESTGRCVSLLLPTKNGASQLRELLPRLLSQRCADELEIIAVDSGSQDNTVEVLRRHHATIVHIDPRSFNHGTTRNLAAGYARGDVLVFLNQSTLPVDEHWLAPLVEALRSDPHCAGVSSRVLPRPDADLLTARDGRRDPSGSAERQARRIEDWEAYRALSHHELRLFINFHTVSAAIRPQVHTRIPFRAVRMGEDILWAKEVLEAGYTIRHEPASVVWHSHAYSYLDLLRRNVDDGFANQKIVGRRLGDDEVIALIEALTRDDWGYLEQECQLSVEELDHWRMVAALRRTAQGVGQWIGVNHERMPGNLVTLLSLTERVKAGSDSSAADQAF